MKTQPKTSSEIDAMREGGAMLGKVLAELKDYVQVGMTTKQVADHARITLEKLGGKPAFLGYHGFPDVICISLNEEVVHGIPSNKRVIKDGDIVSLDFGVLHKGMITDAAFSMIAGKPLSSKDERLLMETRRALDAGVDEACGGVKTGTIGAAVEEVLNNAGYGIVRDFVGHGVGHQLHEEPNVPNYGIEGQGPMLHTGMTIAIEPMSVLGKELVDIQSDGWTVKTSDNSRSAHFEQTVLLTDDGAEVLTPLP
ncbi:type I methionyl aminopeptidase [Candidatus Saccharibacteria bacterium]|nr:type I methionyl aminopeptidase [Candidatus Saccharibacteria bacterium]